MGAATIAEALLAAILAEPADDLHRLAYADWLEEHGEGERAEFIRVQCELAKAKSCPSGEREPFASIFCRIPGRRCRRCDLRLDERELFAGHAAAALCVAKRAPGR